ncbi:hypothetical protein Ciccas_004015 [Cichlidogyrus casuarinus]|uniref:Uncharacterized protein n=1 Tax=Cichlidogyrus casuarinus TaxID=1844966 RepID=A0ABD2QDI8_9PLAT
MSAMTISSPPSSGASTLARGNASSAKEEEGDEWETATEGSVEKNSSQHQKKPSTSNQPQEKTNKDINDRRFHNRGRGRFHQSSTGFKRNEEGQQVEFQEQRGKGRMGFGRRGGRKFSSHKANVTEHGSHADSDYLNQTLVPDPCKNGQDFHFDDGASSVSGGPEFVEVPNKRLQKQRRAMLRQQQEQEARQVKRGGVPVSSKQRLRSGTTKSSIQKSGSKSSPEGSSSKSTPSHSVAPIVPGNAWTDAAKTVNLLFPEKASQQQQAPPQQPTQESRHHQRKEGNRKNDRRNLEKETKASRAPGHQKEKDYKPEEIAKPDEKVKEEEKHVESKPATASVAPTVVPRISPNNVCKVRPQQQLSGNNQVPPNTETGTVNTYAMKQPQQQQQQQSIDTTSGELFNKRISLLLNSTMSDAPSTSSATLTQQAPIKSQPQVSHQWNSFTIFSPSETVNESFPQVFEEAHPKTTMSAAAQSHVQQKNSFANTSSIYGTMAVGQQSSSFFDSAMFQAPNAHTNMYASSPFQQESSLAGMSKYAGGNNPSLDYMFGGSSNGNGSRPGSSFSQQRMSMERQTPMGWSESQQQPHWSQLQHARELLSRMQPDLKAHSYHPQYAKLIPGGQGRQNEFYGRSAVPPTHMPPPAMAPPQASPYVATPPNTPFCFPPQGAGGHHTGAPPPGHPHHQMRGGMDQSMRGEQRYLNPHHGQSFNQAPFNAHLIPGGPANLAAAQHLGGHPQQAAMSGHNAPSTWR